MHYACIERLPSFSSGHPAVDYTPQVSLEGPTVAVGCDQDENAPLYRVVHTFRGGWSQDAA